jgi:phosphatidylglycerophosphate synthase
MDRYLLLAPALALFFGLMTALVVFTGLCALGRAPRLKGVKHNQLFGAFLGRFIAWVLGPLERALVGRVSPNAITTVSLLLCVLTGVAAGLGRLPGAVWMFSAAGMLDVLDGRLARASGQPTAAGALFDSVSDRWGELFAFAGYGWYLHDSPWLFAVMGAIAGSMMVSYTRARAEGLGIELSGGVMQRAERVVLVAAGTLIAAWYGAVPETAALAVPIVGTTLAICAVTSSATALGRWLVAYRLLAKRAPAAVVETVPVDPTPAPAPAVAAARLGPALQHPN